MNFQILSFTGLVVCCTYFIAGFIDSVCGGGGLITVPALMAVGVPTHMVMGTNQSSIILGGFVSFFTYLKSKKIYFLSAIAALPLSMVGSYFGAELNMLMPEKYLQYIMLGLVPVIAVFMIVKKDIGTTMEIETLSKPRIVLVSCLAGLAIGLYQGFYGPGSGMFSMFCFSVFLKLDLLHANGNTKFVVMFSTIVASLNYALSGNVILKIVILATIFNMIGSYCGAKYAIKKGTKGIRPIMFVIIAGLMVKIVMDMA